MTTMHPAGYGTTMLSLTDLRERYEEGMQPEYARRLFNWLRANPGIGIGGGWRPNPSDTSAASRAGKSFHQDQQFVDGFFGYAAVDLVVARPGDVHRAPHSSEVPWQGSTDAFEWGVHANVSSETWHMQAIEMDGFDSWVNAGRLSPMVSYPIPGQEATVNLVNIDLLDTPERVFDSRLAGGKFSGEKRIQIAGADDDNPKGALVTLTATGVQAPGYVTLWAAGNRPTVSNLNYNPAVGTIANTTVTKLDGYGGCLVYNLAMSDIIVDVIGWLR